MYVHVYISFDEIFELLVKTPVKARTFIRVLC